jgi:hypothetical protein
MPRSKHRHKRGVKAIRHPGRNKTPRAWKPSGYMLASRRFRESYSIPFFEAWPDQEDVHLMLYLVADSGFDPYTQTFHTMSRDDLFKSYTEPFPEDEGGTISTYTLEQAADALAFLAEQGMVTIEGDQVMIPSRFVDAFFQSFQNDSATSTVSVG